MEAFHQNLASTLFRGIPLLIVVISSLYRLLRGQNCSRNSGQSREKFMAPGVPGVPGPPAPGPVKAGYKSRAGPACLFTLSHSTLPEELEYTTSNQAVSFQPCGPHFLCTGRQAGYPTAAAVES